MTDPGWRKMCISYVREVAFDPICLAYAHINAQFSLKKIKGILYPLNSNLEYHSGYKKIHKYINYWYGPVKLVQCLLDREELCTSILNKFRGDNLRMYLV